ncbi:MAG TPA: class I SAM-dependent methyltransferase [Spongiibacteraceae bacterium]|nr:class I SAM-dependent methyltransferase [Spongiibacteraceae bacterium]
MSTTTATPWLERWLPLLRERAGNSPLLELGCGAGADTVPLTTAELRVIGIDRSASEIAQARIAAPTAEFYVQDMRANFPPTATQLGAVLASLSLHYFSWRETVILIERIRAVLNIGGILLCRVNSTNDHNYGASGHPPIEQNYYSVDGEPKRFFDADMLGKLFDNGWHMLAMEEMIIDKYPKPKSVWELVVEKVNVEKAPANRRI